MAGWSLILHKWAIVLKEKAPAQILLSSNVSLALAVQEIMGPQLFLYKHSAVTLGQYSPVRLPRSVGKKSVFKAFGWHFIPRDFVRKATYLAKSKQNYDRILHHTSIFFNWIILRKKETEGVKGTVMLFRNGMNLLLEVFLEVIKQLCINCRVSLNRSHYTIAVTKKDQILFGVF